MNSRLRQPEAAAEALRTSGFFRMLTRSITTKISDNEPTIEFAPLSDTSLHEVYCEAVRK
jgi:hypothetical protein